ncbi:RING finger protein [Toxocara canis]|uniref:RING finger protein 141 n=1 Tax=Toxocara canis TaxID=6265 RepID=A0A0B2VSS7_TOXCA|nr:RING finger protein [Toxocara canis]
MGQATSMVRGRSLEVARVVSVTWPQFVDMVCDLNTRCRQLVDVNGRYLVFAVKKGTADSYFWKATIRICVLRKNTNNTTESCRMLTLAQFLSLQKSLYVLLYNMGPESCSSAIDLSRELCTSDYLNSIGAQSECIICMERAPDTILPCAHSYCLVCIEQWKAYGKSLCPVCREQLEVDGNDEWVIPEEPDDDAVRRYLMSLADPCSRPNTAD